MAKPSLGYGRSPEKLFIENNGRTSEIMEPRHVPVRYVGEHVMGITVHIDGEPIKFEDATELWLDDLDDLQVSQSEVPESIQHLDFDILSDDGHAKKRTSERHKRESKYNAKQKHQK